MRRRLSCQQCQKSVGFENKTKNYGPSIRSKLVLVAYNVRLLDYIGWARYVDYVGADAGRNARRLEWSKI